MKHIDKLLENNNTEFVYIFECKNEQEFKKTQLLLFKIGYLWITGEKLNPIDINDNYDEDEDDIWEQYPAYIFVDKVSKKFFYSGINTLDYRNENDSLIQKLKYTPISRSVRFIRDESQVHDEIFNIHNFYSALKFLNPDFKPTYKSKKITKVLENNSQYMYNTAVFIANDFEETKIILEKLFDDMDYEWYGGGKRIIDFGKYPYYILPNIYKKIYHLTIAGFNERNDVQGIIDTVENFYLSEHEKFKIPKKPFNYRYINHLENIFKYGIPKPSYKRKDVKKFEANNQIDNAREIYIKVNNASEYSKFIDLHNNFEEDYNDAIPSISDANYPVYLFYDIKTKKLSYLESDYEEEINNFDSDNELFNGVYKHEYTIKDIDLIKIILEEGKIIQYKPSYKTRKISKLYEYNTENIDKPKKITK